MKDLTNNERAASPLLKEWIEDVPRLKEENLAAERDDNPAAIIASLRQQLSEAREAIVANYKGRVNGFDLARAWLKKYPLDSKEKHDNGD